MNSNLESSTYGDDDYAETATVRGDEEPDSGLDLDFSGLRITSWLSGVGNADVRAPSESSTLSLVTTSTSDAASVTSDFLLRPAEYTSSKLQVLQALLIEFGTFVSLERAHKDFL